MKNKYVAPAILVRHLNVDTFIMSNTGNGINGNGISIAINSDVTIQKTGDILTKERPFYDEDDAFAIGEW